MTAMGRFDGHLVQGHVDAVAEVAAVTPEGDGARMRVAIPRHLERYVVEKGSITIDGASLTVSAVGEGWLGGGVDSTHPRGHHSGSANPRPSGESRG